MTNELPVIEKELKDPIIGRIYETLENLSNNKVFDDENKRMKVTHEINYYSLILFQEPFEKELNEVWDYFLGEKGKKDYASREKPRHPFQSIFISSRNAGWSYDDLKFYMFSQGVLASKNILENATNKTPVTINSIKNINEIIIPKFNDNLLGIIDDAEKL